MMENEGPIPNSPFDYFIRVFAILAKDANRSIGAVTNPDLSDEDEAQYWDRVLARSVFALIEGTTYNLILVACAYTRHKLVLSPEEVEELESYCDLYEFQEPSLELNKARTLKRIQHAFKCFARVFYAHDYKLTDKAEWVLIDDLYDCKRMLTYPGSPDCLIMSDETRNAFIEITEWFTSSVVDLMRRCKAGAIEHHEQENGPIM